MKNLKNKIKCLFLGHDFPIKWDVALKPDNKYQAIKKCKRCHMQIDAFDKIEVANIFIFAFALSVLLVASFLIHVIYF